MLFQGLLRPQVVVLLLLLEVCLRPHSLQHTLVVLNGGCQLPWHALLC